MRTELSPPPKAIYGAENENTILLQKTLMEGQIETVEEKDEDKSVSSSKSWRGQKMDTNQSRQQPSR